MTTIENVNLNTALAYSTDLSSGKLGSSYWVPNDQQIYSFVHNPNMFGHHHLTKKSRRFSIDEEPQQKWGVGGPEERPISSPTTMALENKLKADAFTSLNDQITSNRIFALDNLLLQQRRSFSPPVFDTFYPQRNSPYEAPQRSIPSPVSQSLLAVAQSLTKANQAQFQEPSRRNVFESSFETNFHETSKNPGSKACKRKGGWKFHDLSEDGEGFGKRKRAYGQHKLENEILQIYQGKIKLKEIHGSSYPNKANDKITVIEPSYISDPDLIKHNTSLRLLLDKKNGTYQLQVLPFTIEQGLLADKTQVLAAVSKMLGENGAVLCPGIAQAQHPSHLPAQHDTKQTAADFTASQTPYKTNKKYHISGRWTMFAGPGQEAQETNYELNSSTTKREATDTLLKRLNTEISATSQLSNKQTAEKPQDENACLIWHIPVLGAQGRHLTWPQEAKWCINCLRKL